MSSEALAGDDAVLVDDAESAKVLKAVARVIVGCEREVVEGLEPAVVCVSAWRARPHACQPAVPQSAGRKVSPHALQTLSCSRQAWQKSYLQAMPEKPVLSPSSMREGMLPAPQPRRFAGGA